MAAKVRQVIKEAKRHFWDLICSKAQDPRTLYRILRNFQNYSFTSPDSHDILQNDDNLISDASIQSEILSDHFRAGDALKHLPLNFSENESKQLNTFLPSLNSKMQSALLKAQPQVKTKFQPTFLKVSASTPRL